MTLLFFFAFGFWSIFFSEGNLFFGKIGVVVTLDCSSTSVEFCFLPIIFFLVLVLDVLEFLNILDDERLKRRKDQLPFLDVGCFSLPTSIDMSRYTDRR